MNLKLSSITTQNVQAATNAAQHHGDIQTAMVAHIAAIAKNIGKMIAKMLLNMVAITAILKCANNN